jgi:hypothetical protein
LVSALYAGGGPERSSSPDAAQSASSEQAQTVPANPFYTGNGGEGVSVAILAPRAMGLAEDQDYLPALVQGEFVSNFSGYSAISVLDRQRLDEQYAELLSGYYDDNAEAGQDLGHLTPTDYIMGGTITKTATGYALQMQITKTADKMTAASYSGTCTFVELDNLSGIRRASLDLLQKIGVEPTERTRTELAGAARAQTVMAQTADARGYTADRGGRTAEAAIYYTQAAAIDPSMLQTASRASTLTAAIASGNIGAGTRDLIQQRKDWIDLLSETEETIYNLIGSASSPPYAFFYSTEIKWGDINYQTESRDARFETNLRGLVYWFDSVRTAAQSVYGAVYDGLNKTGHKDEWGLGNWPGRGVTQKNPFASAWRHDINVVFELVNEQDKVIGRQTYNRRAEYSPRRDGNQISIAYNADDFATITFYTVKATDITDRLAIRVASVNGANPQQTPFQITRISSFGWENWERNTFLLVANGVITGFRSGVDTGRYQRLTIPDRLWDEPVTAIGDNAFANKGLTSVTIPDSVITIGKNAFANNQLHSAAIGRDIISIENEVLRERLLQAIPEGGTTIESSAFANNQLRWVTLGRGVASIADNAFANNSFFLSDSTDNRRLNGGHPVPHGSINISGNVTFVSISRRSARSIRDALFPEERSDDWYNFMKFYDRNGKKGGKYTIVNSLLNRGWRYSEK